MEKNGELILELDRGRRRTLLRRFGPTELARGRGQHSPYYLFPWEAKLADRAPPTLPPMSSTTSVTCSIVTSAPAGTIVDLLGEKKRKEKE